MSDAPEPPELQAQLLRATAENADLRQRLAQVEAVQDVLGTIGHDGAWEWNLPQNKVHYTPRWKQILGFAAGDLGDQSSEWLERVHPEERDALREEINVHLDQLTEALHSEHRLRHRDGHYIWMMCRGQALRDAAGKPTHLVGSHTDISGQKAAEQRLIHEAFHDALTGLPNNALLRDRLQRAAACAKRRPNYRYAVLFIDLDGFKNINDSLGHLEGDHLLVGMAERLRNCVRPQDLVARLSGDEFTVLLDALSTPQEAHAAAERIQRALALPFYLDEQELYASVSIGIAYSGRDQADPYDLVRDADTAMFHAKRRKHGFYEIFDASMRTQAVQRVGLESSLRRAIGRQELRLDYQPVVRLTDRRLMGFEALVRWHSGDRGLISPADFIPLAEETGLIVPIGRWVLREACATTQRWHQRHPRAEPLFISVNVSVRQLSQTDIVEQISAVLQDTGLLPEQLKLEVTESLLIDNVAHTAVLLGRLEAMRIRLCMDDFGTGYSSLSTLYQLPIHTLKIDRSFVTRLGKDDHHTKIVETIILLAHNLQMNVIAEGIETADELATLLRLGCDYGQGYYFSRPVAPAIAETLLGLDAL
jgi:diguanylate cyclase (GGDEF)-like protein/PAS domain S-box-containing protein